MFDRSQAVSRGTVPRRISPSWPLFLAMAMSSRRAGGAAEHTKFEGVLAFSNIGLAGGAMTGNKWPKHKERLKRLVSDFFREAPANGRALVGILLNEVGSLSDLVSTEGRRNFEAMLKICFLENINEEPAVLAWAPSPGETMAAFRGSVKAECLPRLEHMDKVARWRTVERFALSGAS